MAFFSSLFSRNAEADDGTEEELEDSDRIPAKYSMLSKGMPLDVSVQKGETLLTGRLTSITDSTMTLTRIPGQLSFATCAPGTVAYISGIGVDSMPVSMRGHIEESTRVTCRIKDVQLINHTENRGTFRLSVNANANIYRRDDNQLRNPEPCKLLDISVGGARIESEYIHEEGDVLRLRVRLDDYPPMTFLGEIIRTEDPVNGRFRYGFLFAQLEERQVNDLTKMLFNIQLGNKRQWRGGK